MRNVHFTMADPPIYAAMTSRRLYPDENLPARSLTSDVSERSEQVHKELDIHGLRLGFNGFVTWKDDEPQLPRNWSLPKKAYNDILVCFFEFWMTAISSSGVSFPRRSLALRALN